MSTPPWVLQEHDQENLTKAQETLAEFVLVVWTMQQAVVVETVVEPTAGPTVGLTETWAVLAATKIEPEWKSVLQPKALRDKKNTPARIQAKV
jgi:hypothetical protein